MNYWWLGVGEFGWHVVCVCVKGGVGGMRGALGLFIHFADVFSL